MPALQRGGQATRLRTKGEFSMSARHLRTGLGRVLAVAVLGLGFSASAFAIDDLKVIAPAKPGGGWDQTARAMQEVLQASGIAKVVTVENVAGAGGIVGLSQLVDREKGNGNALMVNGLVMV